MSVTLREPECVNLEPATDAGVGRGHLSTTGIGTMLACEQRWFWDQERRLAPAIRPVSLEMGAAFAEAVAAGDPEHARATILDAGAQAIAEHGASPWVAVPSREQAEISAQIACEASRAYLACYGAHELREHPMRVRIRNPRTGRPSLSFDLVCRVDGLDLDGGELIEDKLVAQIPRKAGEMDRRLRLDRQVSICCYVTWRTTGVLVERVRYRMTLKPAIRQNKNEFHDDYLARIASEYATRPEHYLAEFEATRTLSEFLRLEHELWRWAEQLRSARADGVWPRNTGACADFGGCRFLPLCSEEPGAEHQYIERGRLMPTKFVRESNQQEAVAA